MNDARACLERGREYLRVADFDGAERMFRSAIAQDPGYSAAYELLGKLLYRDCRTEEAAVVYRAWHQAVPSDPVGAHMFVATGGGPAPPRASDAFIASIYDRAAAEFNSTLARLGYRAPELLFECATKVLTPGVAALDVLDVGCGTGWCGELFRPLARRLTGVDLSSAMLEQSRLRGCYDHLACEDITAYVGRCSAAFDVVVAADVFCYFGDLSGVFAAVAQALRPDGRFIFSVEELSGAPGEPGGVDGPQRSLLEHGRYAHAAAYIDSTLTAAGLERVLMEPQMLRFERGAPVQGLITAASRGK